MSTRSSVFIEISPDVYYGVYRHHDGYIEGMGYDLYDIEKESGLNGIKEFMSKLLDRYEIEYVDYSYDQVKQMWKYSDQEYGYLRHLDGTWEVWQMWFEPAPEASSISAILEARHIEKMPHDLFEIVERFRKDD